MTDIIKKLETKLDEIDYINRCKLNHILQKEDVSLIFSILKDIDKEIIPLLESFQILISNQIELNYLLAEKEIKKILKYYNILPGQDILKSRHQLFFSESRKLIKKPFLTPEKLEKIKNKFKENNLFTKIGIKND